MIVKYTLSKYYDWPELDEDDLKKMTPQDIQAATQAGLLKPSARSGQYCRRVVRQGPTTGFTSLGEHQIINAILMERMARERKHRVIGRKEALAIYIEEVVPLHQVADPSWVTDIQVTHDDGPDPDLLEAALQPFVGVVSQRTGDHLIAPEHVAAHHAAYAEPVTKEEHSAHLCGHFGVKAVTQ
jgi:hypothetical protein